MPGWNHGVRGPIGRRAGNGRPTSPMRCAHGRRERSGFMMAMPGRGSSEVSPRRVLASERSAWTRVVETTSPDGAAGHDGPTRRRHGAPRSLGHEVPRPPRRRRASSSPAQQPCQAIGRGLTLVCTPAGFGKSTLLGDFARQSRHPTAWLSLDTGENDPSRFWRYVAAALEGVRPGVGQQVAPLLHGLQTPRWMRW